MSDNLAAFIEALINFQAELPSVHKGKTAVVKTKAGGEYRYKYADLADVVAVAMPLLTRNGFAFTATPALVDGTFVLRASLLHKDGHRESGEYPLPDPTAHSAQEIGSAITYARRYALTALTGIVPDEDDDGQSASDARSSQRPAARSETPAPRTDGGTVGDQKNRILALGDEKGVRVVEDFRARFETSFGAATADQLREYESLLTDGVIA